MLFAQLVCLSGFAGHACAVRGWGFVAAGFMTFWGGYLLWDEFVVRWLSIRSKSDK